MHIYAYVYMYIYVYTCTYIYSIKFCNRYVYMYIHIKCVYVCAGKQVYLTMPNPDYVTVWKIQKQKEEERKLP